MKLVYHFFLTTCVLLLVACSSDEELALVDDSQTCYSATLRLDGNIQHFDAQTRTTTSEWEDGTKLYIQFQTANKKVNGVATYNEDAEEWEVNYYGNLTRGDTTSCEVYYFENSVEQTETSVSLYQHSVCYADTFATYYYQNGMVTLKTTLKPLTGRIRFKGEVGYTFALSGLKWYSGYDITADTLSSQNGYLTLTVQDNGYTPYIYAMFTDSLIREVIVYKEGEKDAYSRLFDEMVLTLGKSGYITVPTPQSHNGWSLLKLSCPFPFLHPHIIDMGDAGKWACCNVGASSPEDYGDYFAWGEIKPKTTYSWETYKWCNDDNAFKMTKYCRGSSYGTVDNKTQLELSDDAARANWGGEWRMPTIDELSSLINKCTWTWTTINNIEGYQVTATNGNSIFLPAAGYSGWGCPNGRYWSSSLNTSFGNCALNLAFYGEYSLETNYDKRCFGQSVRPVTGAYLNVFPSSLSFSYKASSESLTIATDQDYYTITTSALWIDATVSADKKMVAVTVTENTDTSSRTGTITLEGDELTTTVSITQEGLNFCLDSNHPHVIDMGDAGKWACCNVGASSPIEYGDYFSWGETSFKSHYDSDSYKWGRFTFNKYCNDSYYGTVDNKTQLELSDDAARANWGGSWRMPTIDELHSLNSKCTWTWTTINRVKGYKVTASNGNTLFLPAAGYMFGWVLKDEGQYGYYWSSSLDSSHASYGLTLVISGGSNFTASDHFTSIEDRCDGLSVRPVTE